MADRITVDDLFRRAVAAIDAGDAAALERLVAEHPGLARDRQVQDAAPAGAPA